MKHILKAKSDFRKKGIVLIADKVKSGGGGSWRFAGEDNLIKTIQEPLIECGLEIFTLMDDDSVKVILCHIDSGEMIESKIKLPQVTPRKDRNGNDMYLDAEIEQGKQFGYWARILGIRLLGLSDIDPEDVNNMPTPLPQKINEDQVEAINTLIDNAEKLDMAGFLKYANAEKVEDIKDDVYPKLVAMLKKKQKKD